MKNLLLILSLFLCFTACKQETNKSNSTSESKSQSGTKALPEWAKDATIYEVNLRQYTKEGTFTSFVSHLPRLKRMGVDILWFMPIYPISEKNRKGSLGSYYAVSDYAKINPEHGSAKEFKWMVEKIHAMDMHIILDFVPNHTGWDSDWIAKNPDWFTQDKDGNVIDPIDPGTGKSWGWTDVADLNYDNKEMRAEMIRDMNYWVNDMDIDGFRMDVAHNVPQDFWDEASTVLQKTKNIFMLAESEVESHRNSEAFHTTYGWSFHHLLNEIGKGEKKASEIEKWITEDAKKFNHGFHMHFTSNHDENTWAGTVFDRMGDAHKPLAVLCATIQGMPLLYGGQEEPLKHRLKFFEKDDIAFKDFAYGKFYRKLFDLKHKNKALWNGEYGDTNPKFYELDEDVVAFEREKDGDRVFAIINLSKEEKSLPFPVHFTGKEIFSDMGAHLHNGDKVDLPAYGFKVYSNIK